MINDREFPFQCTGRRSRRFHQGNENARTKRRRTKNARRGTSEREFLEKKGERKKILAWHCSNQSSSSNQSSREKMRENDLILNPKKKKKIYDGLELDSMPIHRVL